MILEKILSLEIKLEDFAISLVLLSLSLFNYFYFILLFWYLYKISDKAYFKYIIYILVLAIGISNLNLDLFGNYYFVRSSGNSSIVNNKVIYEELEPLGIYYIKGHDKELNSSHVLGEFDAKRYYKAKGVKTNLVAESISLVRPSKLVHFISDYLEDLNLDSKTSSYLEAVLLAKNKISKETKEIYSNIGISHIFSVSGLHITLFSLILLKVLTLFFKEDLANDILCFLLGIYILISSFSISVVRASLLFIIKNILSKKKIKLENSEVLSLIIIILLVLNIYLANDASFKLSFITSFTIFKLNDKLKSGFSISLICYLVTLPIIINLNHAISILSPLYNIFYIAFFSTLMMPLALLSFLGIDVFNCFSLSIEFIESLSLVLAEIDVALKIKHLHPLIVIAYYSLLIYLIKNYQNSFKLFLLYIVSITSVSFYSNYDFKKIVMIDVGQGLSIYINDGKKDYLYDTGGLTYMDITSMRVVPLLKYYNVDDLDLFLSHAHFDHVGGLDKIKENFDVKTIYIAKDSSPDLYELVYQDNTRYLEYGDKVHKFRVIAPTKVDLKNENNNSLVLALTIDDTKILLTGDTELFDIYEKADLLFLGHHGSKTSTNSKVIETVRPKYCFASSGTSKFNHPSKEVLDLIDFYQIPLFSTKEDASIYIYFMFNKVIVLDNKQMNFLMGVI